MFPWLDRCVTADVSASAFSVPPQQLITNDGGIIEIGKFFAVKAHMNEQSAATMSVGDGLDRLTIR